MKYSMCKGYHRADEEPSSVFLVSTIRPGPVGTVSSSTAERGACGLPIVVMNEAVWGKKPIRAVAKRSGSLTKVVVKNASQDLTPTNRPFRGACRLGDRGTLLQTLMWTCPIVEVHILDQYAV